MTIRDYRDLIVWQKSMDLTTIAYRLTDLFPAKERFGLVSQVQRRAASIPTNIAEGHERHSGGDFRRHVSIASGSLAELETHLEIVRRLGYVSEDSLAGPRLLTVKVGRMLSTLLRKLRG